MKPQPAHLAAARGPLASTEPSTDLLPAPPIDVRDDVQQRVGQVAVAVEGVVPPTDGYVGEVPVRRQQGGDAVTHVLSRSPPEPARVSAPQRWAETASEGRLQKLKAGLYAHPSYHILPSLIGMEA